MLSDRLTLVHAIWVTERDISLMAEAGVSIVHNSLSNLKTGAGVCPLQQIFRCRHRGRVSAPMECARPTASIWSKAIKATALMHTLGTLDYPNWIDAKRCLPDLATTGGAATGLMSEQVGSLEVGKKADIILLDRNDWGFIPFSDPVHHLAYSVNSEVIRHSIINGKVVMRDRKITTIDEAGGPGPRSTKAPRIFSTRRCRRGARAPRPIFLTCARCTSKLTTRPSTYRTTRGFRTPRARGAGGRDEGVNHS